ncbi:NUDIX domain-containing protein [Planctomycetota bacterium]|nr:NUDIX domain-containing protein [Planctomycetota bacterium]
MQTKKPRIRVAARALIVHDSQLLLLRGQDDDRTYHFLPGGIVHHGETLEDAVTREVKEETDLDVKPTRILAFREFMAERHQRRTKGMPPQHHVLAALFLCELNESLANKDVSELGEFTQDQNAKGVVGMEWVKLEDAQQLEIMPPHVKELIAGGLDKPLQFWPES